MNNKNSILKYIRTQKNFGNNEAGSIKLASIKFQKTVKEIKEIIKGEQLWLNFLKI